MVHALYLFQSFTQTRRCRRLPTRRFCAQRLNDVLQDGWVNALNGAFVQIDDPGLAGVVSKKYRMKVTHTDFHKKSTFRGDHYTLEGSITMKETLISVARRNKGKVLVASGTIIAGAIASGIGAAISIIWR